jgi:hypothetical protein
LRDKEITIGQFPFSADELADVTAQTSCQHMVGVGILGFEIYLASIWITAGQNPLQAQARLIGRPELEPKGAVRSTLFL